MHVEIKILNKTFYADKLPSYSTNGAAAVDLICTENIFIAPGALCEVRTGLSIWIGSDGADNVAGLILPRSGLGNKGLILANTAGLIDADYQGELIVKVWNRNSLTYRNEHAIFENLPIMLKAGERFAQLMFVPIVKPNFFIVDEFSNTTDRGSNGFGSTGQ